MSNRNQIEINSESNLYRIEIESISNHNRIEIESNWEFLTIPSPSTDKSFLQKLSQDFIKG